MSDVSRSCTRCNGLAVTTRGDAAYCDGCNAVMIWSEVIAVVQSADEPPALAPAPVERKPDSQPAPATTDRPRVRVQSNDAVEAGRREAVAPTLTVPNSDSGEPDPFSQRLG